PRLPAQVEGVDRDAVAAEARPGAEAHVAERLRCGGIDDLPDVDSHPVAEDCELVDEGDVDRAEDVLEQLRQLGRLGARELVHGVERLAIEGRGAGGALGSDPSEHLRRRLRRPVLAARVDPFRRHREEEAFARAKPTPFLEDRLEELAGRARPGRRLEHDELTLAERLRQAPCRALNDREVGLALSRQWRRQGYRDCVRLTQILVARRGVDEPALDEWLQPLAWDI